MSTELFTKSIIFQGIDADEIAQLASWTERREYDPGAVLQWEDSPVDGLYFVDRGKVASFRGSQCVDEVDAPTILGVVAVLLERANPVTVRAVTPCSVRFLPIDRFADELSNGRLLAFRLAYNIARVACSRMLTLLERVLQRAPEALASDVAPAIPRDAVILERLDRLVGELYSSRRSDSG
jgi:CRP-like cAMP-binding protein